MFNFIQIQHFILLNFARKFLSYVMRHLCKTVKLPIILIVIIKLVPLFLNVQIKYYQLELQKKEMVYAVNQSYLISLLLYKIKLFMI